MKKRGYCMMSALLLIAVMLTGTLSAAGTETDTKVTDGYYYAQLTDDAKLIYDALADAENLALLKAGQPVTVGEPYTITIPAKPSQEEYNALVNAFHDKSNRFGELLNEMSNAAAAFDRDRSDIFWTSGVYGSTVIKENGTTLEGSVSLALGNTYSISLEVGLYLVSDWDGEGAYDRALSSDLATLQNAVSSLAQAATEASSTRYGRLRYINEQLCKYNDYNSAAANSGGSNSYGYAYPWTAFAALDQLTSENDAGGALKPVCEGYARAFKLICDELGIPCVLVSGKANNEEHMWNYVQMEDGNQYAVDVTWNDSTGNNGYFLVGKDVMDEDHTPHNRFMSVGQTTDFLYPVLSERSYDPNKLTLNPSAETLLGGGTLTLTVGGALEGTVIVVCSDTALALTANGDGTWSAELPNATASYTFTATFTGEGIYHGITATCTVSTTQHTHSYGNWEPHDDEQHRALCVCGDVQYADHVWDSAVTEAKSCGICGYEESVEIPERNPENESGDATDGTNGENQKPVGNGSAGTASPLGGMLGCASGVSGGTVALCTILGALIWKRRN